MIPCEFAEESGLRKVKIMEMEYVEPHNHFPLSCSRSRRFAFRRGIALYLVVIVIAILSLGAFALFSLMLTERSATSIRGDEIQVHAAVGSGIEFLRSVAGLSEEEQRRMGGITNNPQHFAAVEVRPFYAGGKSGFFRFTVVSPKIENGRITGIQYGMLNESARLHLGSVLQWEMENPGQGRRALLSLPGMSPSIADSILDWIDPDKTARSSGAELDYYRRIGVPYGPRNAIPVSLEELLLVRDMNRPLLFGSDETFSFGFDPNRSRSSSSVRNLPGMEFSPATPMDDTLSTPVLPAPSAPYVEGTFTEFPGENSVEIPEEERPEMQGLQEESANFPFPQGDSMEELDRVIQPPGPSEISELLGGPSTFSDSRSSDGLPWVYLLTTLSAEKEVNPRGIPKYDLNEGDLEYLHEQIVKTVDQEAADFVILYRQTGVVADPEAANSISPINISAVSTEMDFSLPAKFNLETPLDLLQVPAFGKVNNPFLLNEPSGKTRFTKLLDHGTTSSEVVISGRININEAPGEVLRAIPGLPEGSISRILSTRISLVGSGKNAELRFPIWLLTENILDIPTLKAIWDKITTGGNVYRAQVIGFLDHQGTSGRSEVVIDATVHPPRAVFLKDLTMYGRGFPLSVLRPQVQ